MSNKIVEKYEEIMRYVRGKISFLAHCYVWGALGHWCRGEGRLQSKSEGVIDSIRDMTHLVFHEISYPRWIPCNVFQIFKTNFSFQTVTKKWLTLTLSLANFHIGVTDVIFVTVSVALTWSRSSSNIGKSTIAIHWRHIDMLKSEMWGRQAVWYRRYSKLYLWKSL